MFIPKKLHFFQKISNLLNTWSQSEFEKIHKKLLIPVKFQPPLKEPR